MSEKRSFPSVNNGRYENPWATFTGLPGFPKYLLYHFSTPDKQEIPTSDAELDAALPIYKPDLRPPPARRGMRLTWLGHATVLAQFDGVTVLTDPIFSDRCSPFAWAGPRRYRPPPCKIEELPKPDVILISHSHYDHLDLNSVKSIHDRFGSGGEGGVRWFVPSGMKSWFESIGILNGVHEVMWWDEHEVQQGAGCVVSNEDAKVKVVAVPAQHWSGRCVVDHNMSLWCGWAIVGPTKRFYFAGDTGYCPAFREIGAAYGPFDASAIPIGCYVPRDMMRNQHIDPAEAVKVHQDVKSRFSIGIHWGTFKMGSNEPYLQPRSLLAEEVERAGLRPDEFVTLEMGQTRSMDS
jgi:N-acyl-phosphatidylethanolamine-hydrolysing phospholipase D